MKDCLASMLRALEPIDISPESNVLCIGNQKVQQLLLKPCMQPAWVQVTTVPVGFPCRGSRVLPGASA